MNLNVLRDGNYVEINDISGIIDFDNDNMVSMSSEDLIEDSKFSNIDNLEDVLGREHLFIYLKNNIECSVVCDEWMCEISFKYDDLLNL